MVKILIITASLLVALNALACGGGKGKDEEEEKDERITLLR